MENTEKIIGEAAYRILMRQDKVNVAQLLSELTHMTSKEKSAVRLIAIADAMAWLQDYRKPSSSSERNDPPLRGLNTKGLSIKLDNDESTAKS